MDSTGFFILITLAAAVTFISYGFDLFFSRLIPIPMLYSLIRLPGIILHEIAHIIGCLITGAEIKQVVFFSRTGGSVTYANPKIPVIGTVIISTMPLLILPLFLSGLTGIFSSLFNCNLPIFVPDANTPDLSIIIPSVARIFSENLIQQFNGWFVVYLYLTTSIVLSLAPSRQDFQNAAIGIIIVCISGLLVIISGYEPCLTALDFILIPVEQALLIGLVFETIVFGMLLPFVLVIGILKKR